MSLEGCEGHQEGVGAVHGERPEGVEQQEGPVGVQNGRLQLEEAGEPRGQGTNVRAQGGRMWAHGRAKPDFKIGVNFEP